VHGGREEVLKLYEKLAEVYEEVYGGEQRRKYWLISGQVGERVVDAGCGVGIALEVLADKYVVCLDLSKDMLRRARDRRGELGELVLGDYWLPPFRDGAFDAALFISSIEPQGFSEAHQLWRRIAKSTFFEFRGKWYIFNAT